MKDSALVKWSQNQEVRKEYEGMKFLQMVGTHGCHPRGTSYLQRKTLVKCYYHIQKWAVISYMQKVKLLGTRRALDSELALAWEFWGNAIGGEIQSLGPDSGDESQGRLLQAGGMWHLQRLGSERNILSLGTGKDSHEEKCLVALAFTLKKIPTHNKECVLHLNPTSAHIWHGHT